MEPQTLTEYECRRLENIKRNAEMMAALNVQAKASQLSATSKRLKSVGTKSYKSSPDKKKQKADTPVIVRRSLRTRGISPEPNGLRPEDIANSLSDRTLKFVAKQPKESPSVLGPLSMKDAYSDESGHANFVETMLFIANKHLHHHDASLKEEEKSYPNISKDEKSNDYDVEIEETKPHVVLPVKGMKKFPKPYEDEKLNVVVKTERMDCSFKNENLVKSEIEDPIDVDSLELRPENIGRVVPGRIMVAKFLPCSDLRMIAAGDKLGNVGFWNLDCQKENEGIYLYRPHRAPLSGILVQQLSLSKIITSCYDGYIRLLDIEKEVFDLVCHSDETIFSLSQRPNDAKSLYFGEGRGGVNIWDLRTRKSSSNIELHELRINTIDFNSQHPYTMVTSSTDRTVRLWDLRSMNANKPKPLTTLSHEKAVQSAYFSPAGSFIATTSSDDTVGILSGANFADTSMVYHNNQTGRWISTFRGIWGWDDSYIYIGNMRRGVDIISSSAKRTVRTLESPDMSSIPCRFNAHPLIPGLLAGATSGGKVFAWTLKEN